LENIERAQFVVLTGHLDDQPLADLFRTLRVQRKSGRLQVEYAESPGAFFFEEGQLVDAQLGALRGLEAVHAALALRGASFNFNPLVRPPERSINRQEQKFINDLAEAPRHEGLPEIKAAGGVAYTGPTAVPPPQQGAPLQLAPVPAEALAPLEARLTAVEEAILSSSQRLSRERLAYAVVISFLVGLAAVMAYAVVLNPFQPAPAATTSTAPPAQKIDAPPAAPNVQATQTVSAALPTKKEQQEAAGAEQRRNDASAQKPSAAKKTETAKAEPTQSQRQPRAASKETKETKKAAAGEATEGGGYVVNVLVQVNRGRVTSARVIDSRPSASAYEAAALGKARQRQYPENFTGGERLRIVVKQ
jgi:Domain of unknown function (DUF4388)